MTLKKVRVDHHRRAARLEARFSPTWTGDPTVPTVTLLPNTPAQASAPAVQSTPSVLVPVSQPTTVTPAPAAVPTTATSVAVVLDPTTPVVSPTSASVMPTTTSSSTSVIVPLATSTASSSSVAQTTPLASPTTSTTIAASLSTFRSLPLTSSSPATVISPSPSSSSSASSGMASGSIIGIVAAGVAAVAVIGAFGIWLLKRHFNSRDADDGHSQFQRHSWMRNSVALPDDMPSPLARGPSETPRPPTMIERKQTHNFSNLAASRAGYPQDTNIGMAYSDYQDSPYAAAGMASFRPGQHLTPSPNSAQPFFSPISPPSPVSPGLASFDETAPAMQHASYNTAAGVPVYFSRHDSNISAAQPDSAALPVTPTPRESTGTDADGYATLDRTSVTPYQAQQYAEISKQLETAQALPPVPEDEHVSPEYIAQEHDASPFVDPAAHEDQEEYQELTVPAPAHPRVDSTPPMLPPMRALSPVGAVGAHASFAQIAQAFPAAPSGPTHPAAVSPKASSFKHSPPLSPVVGAQKGQVVSVPESMHVGRETPVQFGFNTPVEPKAVRRVSVAASAKRTSTASRKSLGKSGRPETFYNEEDAYGGF